MSEEQADAVQTALEHGAAAAAGAAARRSRRAPALGSEMPEGHCANCGTELAGPFCHSCGQSADTFKRPFFRLLAETLDNLVNLDGRLARTLPALFAFPGRVTRAYLTGKRAGYIPPFRLYLIASLAFFLLLPLFNMQDSVVRYNPQGAQVARAELEAARESGAMSEEEYRAAIRAIDAISVFDPPRSSGEADSGDDGSGGSDAMRRALVPEEFGVEEGVADGLPLGTRVWLADRIERLAANPDRWRAESLAWAPRVIFLMLPVFALMLSLVYAWRRGFFYFDHLITGLHFHAVMFLALLIAMPASLILPEGIASLAFLVFAHVWLYRALRVVYGTGRFAAIGRVIVLDLAYGLVLGVAVTAVVLLGALTA